MILSVATWLLLAQGAPVGASGSAAPAFPRIANLWGCGDPMSAPQRWARYQLLVLGGVGPRSLGEFRAYASRQGRRPILLGTGPFMNLGAPKDTPWMRDEWYVRRPDGTMLTWWAGQICVPDITRDDCLDAIVARTSVELGPRLKAGLLDGVFYDSVVGGTRWLGDFDLNRDGAADDANVLDPLWHARQCLIFDRVRAAHPGAIILANDVDWGHAPHVNGRLFEGVPLLDRVDNGTMYVREAIETLNRWMRESVQPGVTFALKTHPLGWEGWRVGKGSQVTTRGEVERARRDFRRMRLGLTTALMTDAYFAYDFGTVWYGLPWWYAEYDAPLGRALGPYREERHARPEVLLDWRAGMPTGAFTLDRHARVTPEGIRAVVLDGAAGWARLFGTDPRAVPLRTGGAYRVEAEIAVARPPAGTLQFNVRTPTGGWERHDKGVTVYGGAPLWKIDTVVSPDDFPDYSAEVHLFGAGDLTLRSLRITRIDRTYFVRRFEGGAAYMNPLPYPVLIELLQPMRRLKDDAAPRYWAEADDAGPSFRASGSWERRAGEGHFVDGGCRVARKPGEAASWTLRAPSTGTYHLFASAPGGREFSSQVVYTATTRAGRTSFLASQRAADGGWQRLGTVRLREGERLEVSLVSGGDGLTAADAVRIESVARWNDGAVVRRLRLGPLDGAVLLNTAARERGRR